MDTQLLKRSMLFQGLEEEELRDALVALKAEERAYPRGAVILSAGDTTDKMGLVLSGSVTIETSDIWGNRAILSHVGAGQFFAEAFALLEGEPILVDVQVSKDCRVLLLRPRSLFSHREPWAVKLLHNLLNISLHKNLTLSNRSFHTAPKTARGRIMSYLNSVSLQRHSREFDIPFDRQQLADYLNLDRSALSKELGKMREDGILVFHKNHFVLKV